MAGNTHLSELGLGGIVSFTVPENARSRRVMEKMGMTHDASEDFDHPNLPEGPSTEAARAVPAAARGRHVHDTIKRHLTRRRFTCHKQIRLSGRRCKKRGLGN
jgi:RimJ/RimL family protein N-acetyltransferase